MTVFVEVADSCDVIVGYVFCNSVMIAVLALDGTSDEKRVKVLGVEDVVDEVVIVRIPRLCMEDLTAATLLAV